MATAIKANRLSQRDAVCAPDAPLRTDFASFLSAVAKARDPSNPRRQWWHEHLEKSLGAKYAIEGKDGDPMYVSKAAMDEGSGATGGYLVPPALSLALLKSLAEKGFIFPRALKVGMGTRTLKCPAVDLSSTATAGVSPFFGGMTFTWGPPTVVPETEPKFREVDLTAWDLLGFAVMSNQFLADAGPEAEQFLVEIIARAAAWQAEYAFLRGLGTPNSMPLGIVNPQTSIFVARNSATDVKAVDIATMAENLYPGGWCNAVWACNPTVLTKLAQLTQFVLNGWHYHEGGAAGFLMTRPLFVTEKLPALGTAGDLVLFDPSAYVIGMRQEVLVDASPHSRFANNQTDFRTWLRLDGKPWFNAPATLADGTTTVSMGVVLQ